MDARARHAKHRAELAETLNLRLAKDTAGAVARAQAALSTAQADTAQLQAAKQASEAQQTGAQQAVAAAQKEASTARSAAAAADEAVSALQRSVSSLTDELGTAKRAVAAKQAALEAVAAQVDGQLRQCAVDGIQLPRLAGGGGGEEEEDGELGPSPDVAAMDVDDGDTAGPSTAPSAGHGAQRRRIDFSSLPRGMRAAAEAGGAKGAQERERLAAELAADVDAKQAALEKLAPNLKAVTQYEAMKERERELSDELEAAKEASKAASDAFAVKRQERYAAFMGAFTHVAQVVDPIYKALTRSEGHPYGGSAELMLENPNEPFLHGVRYIAMPPTKRFRDMEQLSGGEKTVAALALLFLTPLSFAAAAPDWTRAARPTPEGGRLVGNPSAPVRLVAFAAYTCPHCAHFSGEAAAPMARAIRSGRLAVEFRPIVFDQIGLAATMVARCAPSARFWAVNEALYATQNQWHARAHAYLAANGTELARYPVLDQLQEVATQGGIATAAGLTPAQAAVCFADRRILDDTARASDAAGTIARSTPTFLIGRQKFEGLDWAALSTKLRAAGLKL